MKGCTLHVVIQVPGNSLQVPVKFCLRLIGAQFILFSPLYVQAPQ